MNNIPRRVALYLSAKPTGWLILELACKGRAIVMPIPVRRAQGWGLGFVLDDGSFWLFRGLQSQLYKLKSQ